MFVLLTIGVLVASAPAHAKFYKDCGSALGSVQAVGVSGCAPDAQECVLKRNSNASISIDFTPTSDTASLESEVHGVIMNLPVPFPLAQPDACTNSGLVCPLKGGKPANYMTTLPVLKSYPKVKVDVKWELRGPQGDLVCVLIPARIA